VTAFCWSTVQMSEGGDVERTRKLSLSGRAIRHCASSLVSSARQIASERQHWTSYRAYAEHSRALSRALTHLVRFLRYVRASACATHALRRHYVTAIWIRFYRAMLCIRGYSHGPVSVCLSVTSRCSTKTAKRRITQTTPHDSPETLVF